MDKDKLIQQLKEQNKLLRAECKAAEEMTKALRAYLNNSQDGFTTRAYKKYLTHFRLWQIAVKARKATEPPF